MLGVDGGLDLDLVGELGVLELAVVDVGVVWRLLASWQSASAVRKRLIAM